MDTRKVLLSVLASATTGALLGILFAPDKGIRTRKRICRKGEDLSDDFKEKFEDVIDEMTDKFEKVKNDFSDFAKKTTKKEDAEKDMETAKKQKSKKDC